MGHCSVRRTPARDVFGEPISRGAETVERYANDPIPGGHHESVAAIVAFLIRYALGYPLLWISGTATRLARKVAPAP